MNFKSGMFGNIFIYKTIAVKIEESFLHKYEKNVQKC